VSGGLYWSLGEALRGFTPTEATVEAHELERGDELEGGYRILQLLGQGGYGRVYRALDTAVGREVAVKLLTSARGTRAKRFLREGRIAAGLSHPSIGKVYSVGEHGLHPYLVYELLEGARDLEEAAADWTRAQRMNALREVVEGVAHAHAAGVVHRDLKPANVIVDASGHARVIDFGLAKAPDSERLTLTGALVGTPAYLAPEAFRGLASGKGGDVWALGVIAYWLLTDAHPFPAANLHELAKLTELAPPPPEELEPSVPPALSAVCLQALAHDPEDRFPDAGAFLAALDEALLEPKAARQARGLQASLALGLAAALALTGVAGVWALGSRQPRVPGRSVPGTVGGALEAGELQRAGELLADLRESPERAVLEARLAELEGRDPRPALRAALETWRRAELSCALARAELRRGRLWAARDALHGPRLPRWPRDADARELLALCDRLAQPQFLPRAVDALREVAPRAVCGWLVAECTRDVALWRWRHDPRFAARSPGPLAATDELHTRLEALASWGDPEQVSWAREALSLTRQPAPLTQERVLEGDRRLGAIDPRVPPAAQIPRLDEEIARDPLNWHARFRRALVRATDFGPGPLIAALEAISWDPLLVKDLHERVRVSVRNVDGVRGMEAENAVGAMGYLVVLDELRAREPEGWREREAQAVMEAYAVEIGDQAGRLPRALELCDAVLAEHPSRTMARLARAFLLVRAGELLRADLELRVLEAWAPEAPLVAFYRALWLARSQAEPIQVRQALLAARRGGFRGLFNRWGELVLDDYEELVPYRSKLSLETLGGR